MAKISNNKQQTSPPPAFPAYLTPPFNFPFSLPFRKRHASTASASSRLSGSSQVASSPTAITTSEPKSPLERPSSPIDRRALSPLSPSITATSDPSPPILTSHIPLLRCKTCSTHIATTTQIISKGFTGRLGRAYLIAPPPPSPLPTALPFPPSRKKGPNLANIRVGKAVRRELVTGQHTVADIECGICGALIGWKYVDAREMRERYKVGKFILEGGRVVGGRGWEWGTDDKLRVTFDSGDFTGEEIGGKGDVEVVNTNHNSNIPNSIWTTAGTERIYGSGYSVPSSYEPGKELRDLEYEMGRRKPDNGRHQPPPKLPRKIETSSGNDMEKGEIGKEGAGKEEEDDIIVFNSEDEDECDDLFAGVWDAEVVRRRRWRRKNGGQLGYGASGNAWRKREEGKVVGVGGGGEGGGDGVGIDGRGEGGWERGRA